MAENMDRRGFMDGLARSAIGLAAGLAIPSDASSVQTATRERRNFMPDRMDYRRLGKTNMMVSTVALGGASNYGKGQWADRDPSAYRAMLVRLLDLGVNCFDTSTFDYSGSSGYETEDDFAFLSTPANREKVFLCTKVDRLASTRASVEASLKRMKTDYVDLVYIHNGRGVSGNDYRQALSCFDTLDNMIREGKVRFKGMTAHSIGTLTGLLKNHAGRVDVIMGFYSPGNGWPGASGTVAAWESLYRLAKSKDVGVVAMKVLLGAYQAWSTRESALRKDAEAWARLNPFLNARATVSQACIRWALSNENIHTAVIGMRTVAEADEDAAAAGRRRDREAETNR